jgi:hypothetical protein
VSMGEPVWYESLLSCRGIGFEVVVVPPRRTGRVRAVDGLERLAQLAEIDGVTVVRDPGDEVDWRQGWDSRVLSIQGLVADHPDLWALRAKIISTVTVSYDFSLVGDALSN